MKKTMLLAAVGLISALSVLLGVRFAKLAAESRNAIPNFGLVNARLQDCGDRRNCVSSDEEDGSVEPIADGEGSVWEHLTAVVGEMNRARLVERSETYVHFEFSTRFFGFVDDVEFRRDTASGTIAVRSASRVGHSDLGVNRRRVESIRALVDARRRR
jgi:uncharacterized protein (DUF1499 family)